MPVDSWKIVVHNYAPFEREDLVFVNIPLERGTIVHREHNQRELTVFDNRGPGTSDWVQYWPMRYETSDYPWLWRDGSLRLLRLCFPVRLPAGVPRAQRGDRLDFDFYSALECTVALQEHATGHTFQADNEVVAGLGAQSFQLHFEGQVANMAPFASPDHEGQLVLATERQRVYKPPTGGNENLAWIKTFVTQSRTIPPDWRTEPSLWTEYFYQLVSQGVASSKCVDGYLDFGPSRITEDDAPDLNVTPNVRNIQSPVFWRVSNGGAVAPDEKIFMPVWPGTSSSIRTGPNGSVELCAFDPDDYLNNVDLGSIPLAQAREWRAHMNEGSSFPNRVLLHYGSLTQLQDDTRRALSQDCGYPWAIFKDWHLPPWKDDFGPWGFVFPQERFHENDQEAFETSCNHTNYVYRNRTIALDTEENTSGVPGTGRARRDPHAAPVLGNHPDSPEGGGQQDFGFAKCWVHTSPKRGNPDLRAWHANALMYSGFPIERRTRSGRRYIPTDYIPTDPAIAPVGTVAVWTRNGTPFYAGTRPPWANMLGKPVEDPNNKYAETGVRQFKLSSSGRFNMTDASDARWTGGLNAAHQSMNSFGHYLWLRGDPYLLWRLENIRNHTLVSGEGPWRDAPGIGPLIAPYMASDIRWRGLVTRTEARYAQFHHYLHAFGGDNTLDQIIAERICDALYPNRFGNPRIAQIYGESLPTEIPDPLYLTAPLNGQPPGPAYQPFMMTMKAQHFRALARAYEEDAERVDGPPRARELVDKLLEMADDIDDYMAVASITHNKPDPSLGGGGRTWHRGILVITCLPLQPDGRGMPAPLQFGQKLTAAVMSPVAGHRQDGYIYLTSTDAFVFQTLASLEMALFRGLGSESDRANTALIVAETVQDAKDALYGQGYGVFAQWGWGNGESERSSQFWTWFTDERGGFGPYTADLPDIEYTLDTRGNSSSVINIPITRFVATGGKSTSQITTRVIEQQPQINYAFETGGQSSSTITVNVLAPVVYGPMLTVGVSSSSIVTVIRGSSNPLLLGSRLWSWHWAGQFGEHVTLATVGNPNAIDQIDDLSGNGRHLIGMNPDDFGNDRRAGYRAGGVSVGSGEGGPWSTQFPTIASERLPSLLWYANAYRQSESLAAAGEFYLVLVGTNTRDGGYRDMWGDDVDDNVRIQQNPAGGRLSMVVAGGAETWITAADEIDRGPIGIEIWRDASNVIHVRCNGRVCGNGTVLSGTFDMSGFGYRNENAGSTSYYDDYGFELVVAKGATTQQERDQVFSSLAEKYVLPTELELEPIQYSFATGGKSASVMATRVAAPIQYPVTTGGNSSSSITTSITGAATIFYQLLTMGGSRTLIQTRLQQPSVDYSLTTGGQSMDIVRTVVGTRGVGIATRLQRQAYEHLCNPKRFGTEFNYVFKDGTRKLARGLIDWDDAVQFAPEGTGEIIRRIRMHIARHPLSVLHIEPGVEFVEIPIEPGGEVRRMRIVDSRHDDEAWFTVEVQT